jgi:hypothetical protein
VLAGAYPGEEQVLRCARDDNFEQGQASRPSALRRAGLNLGLTTLARNTMQVANAYLMQASENGSSSKANSLSPEGLS